MNRDISEFIPVWITFLSPLVFASPTLAQITPDGTVPTQVNQSDNVTEITGGAEKGNNLFHSFKEFSVSTGNEAFFNIENNLGIENIFSRVTGGSLSNIDGLIRANGSANLFLINPAGILFGANASLNIGGSFYGSTADSLLFNDGVEFSAVDPQNPILTINAPIGLRFRDNPEPITYRSTVQFNEFAVKDNQTLAFVGGDISIEGGEDISSPTILTAGFGQGERIELGGLSATGTVEINNDGSLSFPEGVTRADVSLTGISLVILLDAGEKGGININAGNLELSGRSNISSNQSTASQIKERAILFIDASDKVSLTNQAIITGRLFAEATVDNVRAIDINTGSLEILSDLTIEEVNKINEDAGFNVTNAAQISAFANTESSPENEINILNINASDKVLIDKGFITGEVLTGGSQRGNINITANSLELTNQALIFLTNIVPSEAIADTGKLNIKANSVLVDNSRLVAGLGRIATVGTESNVEITANSVEVVNGGEISSESPGFGDAGSVIIDTDKLTVRDNSKISVSSENEGKAGNLEITANSIDLNQGTLTASTEAESGGNITLGVEDRITLSNNSQITAEATGNANGGLIDLETDNLIINNSEITASATGEGSGGELKIEANSLNLNRGTIAAETAAVTGARLILDIDDNITLSNSSLISARSIGDAKGGSIDLETDNLIINNSKITASATEEGSGGILTIEVDDNIILGNNSQITAQATGDADGGNINIEADLIIAPSNQNSDIVASAEEQGTGGRIEINAEGIFGLEVRPQNNITNDINASGGVDGEVIINTPDVDITKGAIETPQNVLVLEQIVAQACSSDGIARGNSTLIVNGKGGVPPKLIAPIRSDAIYIEGETVNTQVEIAKKNLHADINDKKKNKARDIVTLVENNQPVTIDDIIPAQGAIILENGDVVLTAYPTPNSGDRSPDARKNCAT